MSGIVEQFAAQFGNTFALIFLSFGTIAVVGTQLLPVLDPLGNYGKTYQPSTNPKLSWLYNFTVPKQWFWHFYFVSTLLCLVQLKALGFNWRTFLLLIQSLRRLYEDLYVFPVSRARMHLTHYIVGVGFYLSEVMAHPWTQAGPLATCIAVALFSVAWVCQHVTHRELAGTKKYLVPNFFIKNLACPHYFFELLIYVAFLILSPTYSVAWMSVIWVLASLGISAARTRTYYQRAGSTHIQYAIIPYIL